MDLGSALPALLGTLAGGGITVFGQALADKRRNSATVGAEERAARRAQIERERVHVRDLHDRISEDIACIRTATSKLDDCSNYELALGLDPIEKEIGARHDRAASIIAVVSNQSLRTSADEVYILWGKSLRDDSSAILNSLARTDETSNVDAAIKAFSLAVRTYLETLNASEAASYASKPSSAPPVVPA
jgi:hypothetical protein